MAYTFTRTGAQIEEIHNTVEDPKSNAQFSDDIRTIAGEYRGLWPDTGGSANKGDTYQTQVSGTGTGKYFTALQDTTADPIGDDVNWREVVSNQSLGVLTNYQADSVADMIAGKPVGWREGDAVIVHEVGQVWRVSSGYKVISISDPMALANFKEVALSSYEVSIPSDFPDLQSAVDFHKDATLTNSDVITINIEAGHLITKGLKCANHNYSHIVIKSTEATVKLSPSYVGVDIEGDERANTSGSNNNILMLGINATMPQLHCVIDMENQVGFGDGLNLSNSNGYVAAQSGVINASNRGCTVWSNSSISARESVWSGASDEGVRIQGGCKADFRFAVITDCMQAPLYGEAAVYISRGCAVELRDADIRDSGGDGLQVRRSIVSGTGVDCSGAGGRGIIAESNAILEVSGAKASACANVGIYSVGSRIVADGGTAQGNLAGYDLYVRAGGLIIGNVDTTNSGPDEVSVIGDVSGVSAFNTWYANGAILNEEVEDSVVKGSSGTHTWYKYADGRMEYHVNSEILATPAQVAANGFSGEITKPTLNESFVDIHSANHEVLCRGSASGGGAKVGGYILGRANLISEPVKIFNSGVSVDSGVTGVAVESILYTWSIFGTWK